VTDYATANLVLRVPDNYSTVATGTLDDGFPKLVPSGVKDVRGWKEYQFSATQPVRYLGWATSKFVHVETTAVSLPRSDAESSVSLTGASYNEADVSVESSSLLKDRALELSGIAQNVLKFYG